MVMPQARFVIGSAFAASGSTFDSDLSERTEHGRHRASPSSLLSRRTERGLSMSNLHAHILPLMAAGLLTACADSAATADYTRSVAGSAGSTQPPLTHSPSSTPAAIDPGAPSYEVPVSEDLAGFAHYPIDSVEWSERKGERRLEYTLPADLIGTAQRLELKGPETTGPEWSLQGEAFGTATCELKEGQIVCVEQLAGIPIDLAAVEQRVQAGELPPERLETSKVFQGDPLGILRFPAP
jgi:hypothetical protein